MKSNLNLCENTEVFIPENAHSFKNKKKITEKDALRRITHLAIGAHQDDIEIFAYHGIEECYSNDQNWFGAITVTDGSGSSRKNQYKNYDDQSMKNIRAYEQNKAAFVGDYSIQYQFDCTSQSVKEKNNHDFENSLLRIVNEIDRLQTVYIHNLADKHDTHVALAVKSIKALRKLVIDKKPKKIYGCEVWGDLDWLVDKISLPTSKRKNLAHSLLGVFDSQISGGKRYDLATMGRRYANATYNEIRNTDIEDSLTYAMDLTELVRDDHIELNQFIVDKINAFRESATEKINDYL